MQNEKTVVEHMSSASRSSDLTHRPRRGDVDWLHAKGKAGVRTGSGADILAYDLTLDRKDFVVALKSVMSDVRALAARHGWPMHPLKCKNIAVAALRLYSHPACPTCSGRGMLGVERYSVTESYSPRPCGDCQGSGKRPIPRKHQREIRETLWVLTSRRHEAAQAVRRAMGVRAQAE